MSFAGSVSNKNSYYGCMKSRAFFPLLVLALLGACGWYAWAGFARPGSFSPEGYASRIFDACAKQTYPRSCYDTEIPKLMDQGLTMQQSFAVLSRVVTLTEHTPSPYYFCHIPAHEIAAKEVAKDPAKWASIISQCPAGQCSNGCLHGAFQERFRNDTMSDKEIQDIVPALKQICSAHEGKDFTPLEVTSCHHALGHLTMYIAGGNVTRATNVCDMIVPADKDLYRRTCYEGAFMQLYQPLEPEDVALVQDVAPHTALKALTFCRQFTDGRLSACNVESWPLSLAQVQTPQGLQSFCSLTPTPKWIQRCYNDLFYILTAKASFKPETMAPFCQALPKNRMAQCFANAASASIETDYQLGPQAAHFARLPIQKESGTSVTKNYFFIQTTIIILDQSRLLPSVPRFLNAGKLRVSRARVKQCLSIRTIFKTA